MKKIFDNDHPEPASPLQEHHKCWYLPFFGMYHPRKAKQIRVVFNFSSKYQDVSNDVLLLDPNLTYSLVEVLMKFRWEPVAKKADIEQMFNSFIVQEDHRNFRFLWHHDNIINNEVTWIRHENVFVNSPSPAVATFGLWRTALDGERKYGEEEEEA